MSRALGEKQQVVDMVNRKSLGLFARHFTQTSFENKYRTFG
jgi:hypothetical protein